MNLYLIVGKNEFYLFRRAANKFEIEYVDGNPCRRYNLHSIGGDLEDLLATVADNNNLSSSGEIYISVIENADKIRNLNVEKAIKRHIKEKISLDNMLRRAMDALARDKNLYIADFGINYDGESYTLRENILERRAYNLLAYNVSPEKLIEFI